MVSADHLLQVEGLKTWFGTGHGEVRAVDGIDLAIRKAETFALLGESGCGKSMTALSLMRLVPQPAGQIVSGRVLLDGEDLLALPETAMRKVRGNRISMIFQEPMTSLNPVLSVGFQVCEAVTQHIGLRGRAARRRVIDVLDAVGIPDPVQRYDEYPHQLSGGMKQRVMIAMALVTEPQLLIADEPTTALDVTIQAQILELLRRLQQEHRMSILLITHDLGVVAEMADHVAVMYAGHIVEQARREEFFSSPQHPYSCKLFESMPTMTKRGQRLAVIRGSVPSLTRAFPACRFEDRCDFAWDLCRTRAPRWLLTTKGHYVRCHLCDPVVEQRPRTSSAAPAETSRGTAPASGQPETVLSCEGLQVFFPVKTGFFRRTRDHVRAVDEVSMRLRGGCTSALVGESGCGKTTTGKALLQLIRPTAGSVRFGDHELTTLGSRAMRRHRAALQIVFQDPYSSMNPRMMVGDIVAEGMIAQHSGGTAAQRSAKVDDLLQHVGLPPEVRHRYPHEFSGGQRQRICIARALAVDPKLIVCDEPTSALDVSVQAQILNLLKSLQDDLGLAYLFITHNISVVEYLAHEVAVMYLGRIVEEGRVDEVLTNPLHPYTKALLSAVPSIDAQSGRTIIRLEGDLPSPVHPPRGCHFHPRCPHAMAECRERYPEVTQKSASHWTRCYLVSP